MIKIYKIKYKNSNLYFCNFMICVSNIRINAELTNNLYSIKFQNERERIIKSLRTYAFRFNNKKTKVIRIANSLEYYIENYCDKWKHNRNFWNYLQSG